MITANLERLFRDIPDEAARPALALLNHRDYEQAEHAYLKASRAMLVSTSETMKLLGNLTISRLELMVLSLHAQKEIEGVGRGASVSALQQDMFASRFTSPRTINDFVERLVQSKRLTREKDPDDHRVRRLIPTEILIGDQIQVMSPGAAALEVIYPGTRLIETWRNDHREFLGYCLGSGRLVRQLSKSLYETFGAIGEFEMHDGGIPLMRLFCLTCYETHGRLATNLPIAENRSEASRSLRISLSQVGKLIELGIADGLFIDVPPRGMIMITDKCIDHWRGLTGTRISSIREAVLAWQIRKAAL